MCQCTHIRCNNVPVTSSIVIKTVTSSFLTILHKGHFCSACSLYNIHHWTLCKKICLCTVADLLDFRKQLKTYFLKLLITMTFNFLVFNVFMECCNARVFVTGALEISRWWWWWQTPHVCTNSQKLAFKIWAIASWTSKYSTLCHDAAKVLSNIKLHNVTQTLH